jgi:pyrroline-5-carboxylate reductase
MSRKEDEVSKAVSFELCVVGTGNMGEAILGGVLGKKIFSGRSVAAVEVDPEKRKKISSLYRILCSGDLSLCRGASRVLLAVKPQNLDALLSVLGPLVPDQALVISVAAGKTLGRIGSLLRSGTAIVRVMPNMPALVRNGISGVCFNPHVSPGQKKDALRILRSIGRVLVTDESMMNAVTAVSGSGPAYVYYFIEAFLDAARSLGFSGKEAEDLVRATMKGALALMEKTGEGPEALRQKVTSRGGTTESALLVLESARFKETFISAVRAAEHRASELSKS